jgi:hypothetical protein
MHEPEHEHEHEAWEDLRDPWAGDHDIEYWVWHVDRLVPATPGEVARIQEEERTRDSLYRLERMQQGELHASFVPRPFMVRAWGGGGVRRTVQWLRNRRRHGQAPEGEGARAERSSAR